MAKGADGQTATQRQADVNAGATGAARSDDHTQPGSARERLAAIETKWTKRWDDAGLHVAEPDPDRPKYFATYPYSYMNAFAHVGHAYTSGRVDFMVRYQRLKGNNVLFPFGFHITGTPIVAAAARVAKGDETQLRILRQSGIPADEVPNFADPQYWIDYFPDKWREDVTRVGFMIDWRRSFVTTDKNPWYDAFIRWQFLRLKEKQYVRKGRHPVIWDPVEEAVIGDHDRAEGEGVAPQEGVLLLFPLQGDPAATADGKQRHLVAATLRPETVFGQTNLWVDPSVDYVELEAPGGTWIVSAECAGKLGMQELGTGETVGHVAGKDLVGTTVLAPGADRELPVLPATFMKTDKWTGIVTSVPSDAPLDLVAVTDLKNDPSPITACGVDASIIDGVSPIEIIQTEGLGTKPAAAVVKRLGIKKQTEEALLKQATEEVYADAFYKGTMLDHCGPVAGKPVAEAKEEAKAWLLEQGKAHLMWEPESRVVSRHGHEAVVKIVSDQWFMAYGDPEWKKVAHGALDSMTILPELARKQFHIVIDWLKDWACAREAGLGTRIPWDDKWLIESLSDSTIYMAYYTIHHHLVRLDPPATDLTPGFWDHIMLGRGDASDVATEKIPTEAVHAMRDEFAYWYPLDFRNSGKDLLQNHLTFAVFNHCALFPKEHWMQGIGVNGWVTVDGEKMSKSKGNFITLRQALDDFGTSETRFALAFAGEGVDDANFEQDVAHAATRRLTHWLDQCTKLIDETKHETGPDTERSADRWIKSVLHRTIRDIDQHMANAEFKTALKVLFHDLNREWTWYVKRSGDRPDPRLTRDFVSTQTRLMAVYVPHLAEEVWAHMGNDSTVVDAAFPEADASAIDPVAERTERYIGNILDDVRSILKLVKHDPEAIHLYTTPQWKRTAEDLVVEHIQQLAEGQRPDPGDAIKTCMADPALRKHGKAIPQFVNLILKSGAGFVTERNAREGIDEEKALDEARGFIARELGAPVHVWQSDDESKDDPAGKSKHAIPGRPAVYVA